MIIPGKGKSGPQGGGLSPGELTPGTFVTVSENKRISDRSLVDAIWEIIAVNDAHCVLKFHRGNRPLDPAFLTRIVLPGGSFGCSLGRQATGREHR